MSRGFEGVNPEILSGIEERLVNWAVEERFGDANPPAEALADISAPEISDMFANLAGTLSSGDPRIEGQVTLRGSRDYLHAVHGIALKEALQAIFGPLPEDEVQVINLQQKITALELRNVVSVFFRTVEQTHLQSAVSGSGFLSLRTRILELERARGINDEEALELRGMVKAEDEQLGRSNEEADHAWGFAQSLLFAWDVIDEELEEKRRLPVTESKEIVTTSDEESYRQLEAAWKTFRDSQQAGADSAQPIPKQIEKGEGR